MEDTLSYVWLEIRIGKPRNEWNGQNLKPWETQTSSLREWGHEMYEDAENMERERWVWSLKQTTPTEWRNSIVAQVASMGQIETLRNTIEGLKIV
jgi:hypothetical protein